MHNVIQSKIVTENAYQTVSNDVYDTRIYERTIKFDICVDPVFTKYYSQNIGYCLENYAVYFVEYVTVYCLMFEHYVYVDTMDRY